jgi:hypothetical protein
MALLTSSAAYAQNTAVEIHQYFWAPGVTPGQTPVITATPGSDVTLTVYLRALQGNGTGQLGITQYAYEIGGQGGTGFSAGPANQLSAGASYVAIPGTPVAGNGVGYNDGAGAPISPAITQLFGLSGASSGAGAAAGINSAASGDGTPGALPGAFMIETVTIHVAANATGTLNLYFTTPKTGGSIYQTASGAQSGVGSLTTVAFGANTSGQMDQKRYSNTTADIVGSLNDRVSTTPDAVIQVPEPGTLALLAIGLLGLRRRRSA